MGKENTEVRAFILCAGLGTRLRPLTYAMPKALLPVFGRPAILHIFEHLKSIGIAEVIINIHHLPSKFRPVLGNGSKFGIKLKYSYEKKLLDTGGGLKKVEYFLRDETFIMYNCDVITNFNLKRMINFHKKNRNYITLLASRTREPKHILADSQGMVRAIGADFKGNNTFCGIHIIEPFIFKYIPSQRPISIIQIYKKLIEKDIPVHIYPLGKAFWQEIGDLRSYEYINRRGVNEISL